MATYTVTRRSAAERSARPEDTLLRHTYVLGDSKIKLELKLPGDLPLDQIDALLAGFAEEIEQVLDAHRTATRPHQHTLPTGKNGDKTSGYAEPAEGRIRA